MAMLPSLSMNWAISCTSEPLGYWDSGCWALATRPLIAGPSTAKALAADTLANEMSKICPLISICRYAHAGICGEVSASSSRHTCVCLREESELGEVWVG
jgi:hypothetical protein